MFYFFRKSFYNCKIMITSEIIEKYQKLHASLKYDEAQELMQFLDDTELEDLYYRKSNIFTKLQIQREDAYKVESYIDQAISLFLEVLSNKGISKEEYKVMNSDELITYITKLVTKEELFDLIKQLEKLK